jgi:hypothetical protein
MAYRTFLDDNGRYWQVWDYYRQVRDRRREERRKKSLSWPHGERRKTDRRTPASVIDQAKGWLCFESFSEKRRLSPIPPHWEEFSVIELIQLWKRAMQVAKLNGESVA